MKTAGFFEISVNLCQVTLCHIPEYSNLFRSQSTTNKMQGFTIYLFL